MTVWDENDHSHRETNEFKILAANGVLKQRYLIFKLCIIQWRAQDFSICRISALERGTQMKVMEGDIGLK